MRNAGVASLLIGLSAALLSGCSQDCRITCTAWFDYQRDVCGVLDTDDERVRCISDYTSSATTETEQTQCREQTEAIEALTVSEDTACCDSSDPACTLRGDDDDSADDDDSSSR